MLSCNLCFNAHCFVKPPLASSFSSTYDTQSWAGRRCLAQLHCVWFIVVTAWASLAYEYSVNSLSVLLLPHRSLFGRHITVAVSQECEVCVCGKGVRRLCSISLKVELLLERQMQVKLERVIRVKRANEKQKKPREEMAEELDGFEAHCSHLAEFAFSSWTVHPVNYWLCKSLVAVVCWS